MTARVFFVCSANRGANLESECEDVVIKMMMMMKTMIAFVIMMVTMTMMMLIVECLATTVARRGHALIGVEGRSNQRTR